MAGMTFASRGTLIDDSIDIEGYAAVEFVIGAAAAAQSAILEEGLYDIWCTSDVRLKVAPTANDVTATNGYLLRQNNTVTIKIRGGSRIGGFSTPGGTLSYHKVG